MRVLLYSTRTVYLGSLGSKTTEDFPEGESKDSLLLVLLLWTTVVSNLRALVPDRRGLQDKRPSLVRTWPSTCSRF